jgi:hypothetical protein
MSAKDELTQGQCLCGKIKFEISGGLGDIRLCYCELCRRANGTAFSANIPIPITNYSMRCAREYVSEYESSPGAFRAFCSICGSPVFGRTAADPDHIRVRLGTLSRDANARILAHVWVRSKPHWYTIEDDLPQFEEGVGLSK